jgi:acylphosphatase
LTRPGWDGACPSGRQAFAAADLAAGVKRLHVWVSGTVQGVFFRESARAEAERRGVAGWVRNLPDGRVEAVFEGPAVEAEAMVDWCRRGPPDAAVERLEAREEDPRGDAGFAVLREGRR